MVSGAIVLIFGGLFQKTGLSYVSFQSKLWRSDWIDLFDSRGLESKKCALAMWMFEVSFLWCILAGDWMKAHRWFNTVELFMLPLLLLGGVELASHLPNKEWNISSNRHDCHRLSPVFYSYYLGSLKFKSRLDL